MLKRLSSRSTIVEIGFDTSTLEDHELPASSCDFNNLRLYRPSRDFGIGHALTPWRKLYVQNFNH